MDERAASRADDGPSDGAFHTAMAHLYRAEVHRMTVWRQRLDTTSNWAILLTTGLTTFTLGSAAVPHYTLLLGLALNTICMLLEARRYQHLSHSQWRLQQLERGYFAPLVAPDQPAPGWRASLAADLREPRGTIGIFPALRRRLRRNYVLLFYFITAVWLTKLFIHGFGAGRFYDRLAVGNLVPSWFVGVSAAIFIVSVTALALATESCEAVERRPGPTPERPSPGGP
jgi:uncharacterized membrane protein